MIQKLIRVALLISLLSGSTSISYCQDSLLSRKSMLIDSVKKRGVYRSLMEFQQNNPSYSDTFIVKPGKWKGDKYELQTINSKGKSKKLDGNIWGYCDGKDVFIRSTDYSKLVHFGYFCVFKGTGAGNGLTLKPDLIQEPMDPMHHGHHSFEPTDLFILNYTTGRRLILGKANLATYVLSKDPALLEQFRKEEKGKKLLLEYVLKFNERNTSKLL